MSARRLLFALLLAGPASAALAVDPARYMSAQLIAQSPSPAPGSTILVGLRLVPKPGWHGYWSNPGDAGFAPTIQWSAPDGITFGPLLHPAPRLISAAGIASYVHEGEHIVLSRMTVPRGLARGAPIPVTATANWAACTATMCVPLKSTFRLDLEAGSGEAGPAAAALAAAVRELPRPASGGTYWSNGGSVRLALPSGLRLEPLRTRFFPDDNDSFRAASGRASAGPDGLVITGSGAGRSRGAISGVATDGRSAYRLTLARKEPQAAPAKLSEPAPGETAPGETEAAAKTAASRAAPAAGAAADDPASKVAAGQPPASGQGARPLPAAALTAAAALAAIAGLAALALRRRRSGGAGAQRPRI